MIKIVNFIGPKEETIDRVRNIMGDGSFFMHCLKSLNVHVTITAPLYFWYEFDNRLFHDNIPIKDIIPNKEFTMDDFSTERLSAVSKECYLKNLIEHFNFMRDVYHCSNAENVSSLHQIISMLPGCYNLTREIDFSYKDLYRIYHIVGCGGYEEWRELLDWITELPGSELIYR